MTIWVDADACPKPVIKILFKAAERTEINLILVANRTLATPKCANIRSIQVATGFDVADTKIISDMMPGDLVVTSDIPLAADVIKKGAQVLSPRGGIFNTENIGARLNMRDFMDTMRSSGLYSKGPLPFTNAHRKTFADQLDGWLARYKSRSIQRCSNPN